MPYVLVAFAFIIFFYLYMLLWSVLLSSYLFLFFPEASVNISDLRVTVVVVTAAVWWW